MPSLVQLIKQTYKMALPKDRQVVMDNVAALSILQAITFILPILIVPYLFRRLGVDKFGLIAFAQAFVQYFVILTNYGFNVSATKEISLCRHEPLKVSRAFSSVMIVKFALTLVSLVFLGALVYFLPKFRNDWPVYVLSFGNVIGSTLFPVWFFQGTEKMKYISNLNIVVGVLSAIAIFLLIQTPKDYLLLPLIYSCSYIVTGLLGQYIVLRRFQVSFQFHGYKHIQQQLKGGWDVFISVAAINAYTTTRVFVLGLLTNNNITGFYSIAEQIANAVQTFPLSSFSQAIFPRLSNIFHKDKVKAFKLMRRIQRITTILALMVIPLMIILSDSIVTLVCGGDYPKTVLSLKLLLVAVFFVNANAFRVQFLLVSGKTRIYSQIHVIMSMIGVPLIFLFIYAFSFVGAAIATCIIEAGVFTVTYFTVRSLRFGR